MGSLYLESLIAFRAMLELLKENDKYHMVEAVYHKCKAQLKLKDKIVRSDLVNSSNTLTYKNLKSGDYTVHITKDKNQNGIWDTGNIFTKTSPEPIQISESIEIRDNWDKELIINVL